LTNSYFEVELFARLLRCQAIRPGGFDSMYFDRNPCINYSTIYE